MRPASLTTDDWDEFEDVMTSGTTTEKQRYNCWMKQYLTGCDVCIPCPGTDPFDD